MQRQREQSATEIGQKREKILTREVSQDGEDSERSLVWVGSKDDSEQELVLVYVGAASDEMMKTCVDAKSGWCVWNMKVTRSAFCLVIDCLLDLAKKRKVCLTSLHCDVVPSVVARLACTARLEARTTGT